MLMIEKAKAEIIERRTIDARNWLTIRTVARNLFSFVQPEASGEIVAQMMEMMEMARQIVEEERGEA